MSNIDACAECSCCTVSHLIVLANSINDTEAIIIYYAELLYIYNYFCSENRPIRV